MTAYEAPAKLNLSLLVSRPRSDGYHPIRSMVQTIGWCDLLTAEEGDGTDSLDIEGADLDVEGNLVLSGLESARTRGSVPPLALTLEKRLPIAAGLGGGSSDAAAVLLAASDFGDVNEADLPELAIGVGADVALFLTGGTLEVTGVGGSINPVSSLEGFAVAIAVPSFGLATADVYERWDRLDGPEGEVVATHRLPPALRDATPIRNDLLPAAVDLEPRLGDFMADLRSVWGSAVGLTGSGSGCFGYFGAVGEAEDAAIAVEHLCRVAVGVGLRDHGVARV